MIHSEESHNVNTTTNTVLVTEFRSMEWARKTGRFIMFSVITNIYNKKTKGPTLMELFTVRKTYFFFAARGVQ